MPRALPHLLLLLLILTSPLALAQVRCDLPGGKVLYTDDACPAGAKARGLTPAAQPSEEEAGRALSDSAMLQWRGNLAGERAAQRAEADAERARLQRAYEREAAERSAMIDAQRRQADALERLAREAQQARTYVPPPRRKRCRTTLCR